MIYRRTHRWRIYVDLLTCGNGQWGQLVDSPYSIVQGNPVCAKNVSDLRGCNKDSRTMSPTGHVPLTLGSHEGPGGLGRGLVAWGTNHDHQLVLVRETVFLHIPPRDVMKGVATLLQLLTTRGRLGLGLAQM